MYEFGALDPVVAEGLVPFENVWVQVEEYDEWGAECRHWHIYDESQLPEAVACYESFAPDGFQDQATS